MVDKPKQQKDLFESSDPVLKSVVPREEPKKQSDRYKLSVKLGFTPVVVGSLDAKGQVDLDAVEKVLDLEPEQSVSVTKTDNHSFVAMSKKGPSLTIAYCLYCKKKITGKGVNAESKVYCSDKCRKKASADRKIIEDSKS